MTPPVKAAEGTARMISLVLPKDPAVLVAIGKVAIRHSERHRGFLHEAMEASTAIGD